MKVSCILTSYNRPRWVRDAIKSVADQTYKNYQLIVLDESDIPGFDIHKTVRDFKLSRVDVRRFNVTDDKRKKESRLAIKINRGLRMVKGDLVCYLCDDDYFYPTWFEKATDHFKKNKDHSVIFGALRYSYSREMVFPKEGPVIFYKNPVPDPLGHLNHDQVMYRRFEKPYEWPEGMEYALAVDGYHFRLVAKDHTFFPIFADAAVRREHPKSLMRDAQAIFNGTAEKLRE